MTGFALLLWVVVVLCIERELKSRIKKLEEQVTTLRKERRVILGDDIERLEWISIPMVEGTHLISMEGVRENPTIDVLTYKSKHRKAVHG